LTTALVQELVAPKQFVKYNLKGEEWKLAEFFHLAKGKKVKIPLPSIGWSYGR